MWSGLGSAETETSGSAALGDDAEAIVLEVSEAIGASLDVRVVERSDTNGKPRPPLIARHSVRCARCDV